MKEVDSDLCSTSKVHVRCNWKKKYNKREIIEFKFMTGDNILYFFNETLYFFSYSVLECTMVEETFTGK